MRSAVLLLLAAALSGCGSDPATPRSAPTAPTTTGTAEPVTVSYAPGLTEDLYLPDDGGHVPLVVMVPGGGWTTADPSGFAGLAASLAEAGVIAAPTHIRAAEDGVTYPVPVEDILCAVATATAEASDRGFTPDPVAVLGHSSGAHLASLAVLAVDDYSPRCQDPVVEPDALVGLAGPYDISKIAQYSTALFGVGPDEDPAAWEAANPVHRADLRPGVPVLLLHGDADQTVPVSFTTDFAEALEGAEHPTSVSILPGEDHFTIFAPAVSGDAIAQWVSSLG